MYEQQTLLSLICNWIGAVGGSTLILLLYALFPYLTAPERGGK